MMHFNVNVMISTISLAALMAFNPAAAQHAHDHGATSESVEAKTTSANEKPTAEFRNTHKVELQRLAEVQTWSGTVATQSPDEQKKTAARIVDFFRNDLIKHATWEEAHLYPLIDKLTNSEKNPFTATMRHEHKIVVRWTEALEKEMASPEPDYRDFVRKTDMLIGLVKAHFELEDEVLLPYVDKSMTREEFEKALGDHQ